VGRMARQRYGPRRWPLYLVGAIVVVAFLFNGLSRFVIDLLWFREVHLSSEFWTILRTKIVLGALAGILFFVVLYLNLLFVKWLTPETRILTPDLEAVERFRSTVDRSLWWALPVFSAVIALFVGVSATHEWQTFLLWRNSSGLSFGHVEPLFHRDPAFYIFSLPWLKVVQGWLFSTLVGVLLLVAIGHFLWGGIRPQAPSIADKVAPPVRAHLSVLLGLIMVAKAWGYWLGRFDLLTSPRGVVEGASYTDVHAQLPALTLLAVVALICAILFLVNIRVRLWSLPVISVALLFVVSILLGAVFPAVVQAVSVKPQEFQAESRYIQDNITGTRLAFGLDNIQVTPQTSVAPAVTTSDLKSNVSTVQNIRLWRPGVLQQNFEASQQNRQYYTFQDVDVDRYMVGVKHPQEQMLMVSARQINQNDLTGTGKTWQNQHLVYTHGYGAVASLVNAANSQGAPVLTIQDIPPVSTPGYPQISVPEVYYGENQKQVPFVVVDTKSPELDYEGAPSGYRYVASSGGGIPVGNIFERALFAWRYRDVNLMISRLITPISRIMINRDIVQRAQLAAPFLKLDGDPYMAIVDGQIDWIIDAYTTTDAYPYSQSIDLASATGVTSGTPGLTGSANYIRNSVKIVINAYSGQMTFYDVSGGNDPIIKAWEQAFPGMFTTQAAPASLAQHFRYPENLFQVQSQQFALYHVTDPQTFFKQQDAWQVPIDPATGANANLPPSQTPILRPTYMLTQLPGDKSAEYVLFTPFVPAGRSNPMVSWMAARCDPGNYGQIVSHTLPTSLNVDAPPIAFSRINQDPRFSGQRTLLSQAGSRIFFGDLLTIPIGNSFIYVQPVYVRTAGQSSAVPELKFVAVVDGGSVGFSTTLDQALSQVTGAAVPGQHAGQGGHGKGATVQQQIQRLLSQALAHFNAANQALQSGDLGRYQSELKIAQSLVQKANGLAALLGSGTTITPPSPIGTPSPTGTPSPGTSPSASSSPTP
jgi:uncharacterized membrane protein (UPF0182 family)